MTADEFSKIGEGLFGKRWKAPLARLLDLDDVTVWRYATGRQPIPKATEIAMKAMKKDSKP